MMAAHALAAERKIVKELWREGTLSPESARPLPDLGGLKRRRLSHLIRRGVVREAAGGLYYLDVQAWSENRWRVRRTAILLVAVFAIAGVIAFLILHR